MLHLTVKEALLDSGWMRPAALLLDGARIAAAGSPDRVRCPAGAPSWDLPEFTAVPGFIDLQINGAHGHDFTTRPESLAEVAGLLPATGVTAFLPTLVSSHPDGYSRALAVERRAGDGAVPLGWHFEGPFLDSSSRGAHDGSQLRDPDGEEVARWLRASPGYPLRMVTLAPERRGAGACIAALVAGGVKVSAGHSRATLDEARAAFAAGVQGVTHLFNAMSGLSHRNPGLAAAALLDPAVRVGLIADGVHVHPRMLELAIRTRARTGLMLVTDAVAAMGMPAGRYELAGQELHVDSRSARLADGTLAGSILTMDQAVRNLVRWNIASLREAVDFASREPARFLGEARGELREGFPADVTLLDAELEVAATLVGGRLAYERAGWRG